MINGNKETRKSRNLSPLEYLRILQLEYFVCEFRFKIHYDPHNKKYWKFQMENKKDKIFGLGNRIGCQTIFDNKEEYKIVRNEIYSENGMPNVDVNNYYHLTEEDIICYYLPGQDAFVKLNGDKVFGKITKAHIHENRVWVHLKDEQKPREFGIHEVTRVL